MSVIVLQCGCKENIMLVVDTETGLFMGWCPKCRRIYEMMDTRVDAEELDDMKRRARPALSQKAEALYYLRCTGVLR